MASNLPDPTVSSLRELPNTMAREVDRWRMFVWQITKQVLCYMATSDKLDRKHLAMTV